MIDDTKIKDRLLLPTRLTSFRSNPMPDQASCQMSEVFSVSAYCCKNLRVTVLCGLKPTTMEFCDWMRGLLIFSKQLLWQTTTISKVAPVDCNLWRVGWPGRMAAKTGTALDRQGPEWWNTGDKLSMSKMSVAEASSLVVPMCTGKLVF